MRQYILAFIVLCFAIAPNMGFAMPAPNNFWHEWNGKDIGELDEHASNARVTDKTHDAVGYPNQPHAAGFARVTNNGGIAITRNNHLKVSSITGEMWGQSTPFVGGYSMGDGVPGATMEATDNSVTIDNAKVTNLAAYGGVSFTEGSLPPPQKQGFGRS